MIQQSVIRDEDNETADEDRDSDENGVVAKSSDDDENDSENGKMLSLATPDLDGHVQHI